jgi:hypothetical protein
VSFCRRLQTVARFASLAAALLIGADDADMRLADGLRLGAGSSGAFVLFASAAAAEAVSGHAAIAAQAGPQISGGSLDELFKYGGLLGEFAAGFLGSGLLGLLFGRSLTGGMEGIPSYFGLLFQLALLVLLCRLIWTRWHSGDAVGPAALSPRQLADNYLRTREDLHGLDVAAGENGRIDPDPPAAGSPEVTSPHDGRE